MSYTVEVAVSPGTFFWNYIEASVRTCVRRYVCISAVSSPTGEINRTLSESGGDAYVRILGGSSRVTLIGNRMR